MYRIVFFLVFVSSFAFGQTQLKPPSEFYPKQKTKVLVVGTFHFDFPGLDQLKTTDENKIDVLKEPKKSELEELVAYIKKFKPTKIAIEAQPKWNTMEKYEAYKNGEHRDNRDERYQLGMRIAMEMGLDSVYGIDTWALSDDLYKKDSIYLKSLVGEVNWDMEDPYWKYAEAYFEHRDKMMKQVHLLDYFKSMNSREAHNANFGLYLTGAFSTGGMQGADNLSIWWYNRNARIFSKLVQITESPEERILVVFGNGHAAILRQLLEASPQYEFVEFSSLEEK
ncbi:DUF5694 domain-containing protein [Flagellimonas zhangzhouensis]|uniref:Haem-binding uptake, Tiki superfamily, ChaN n=1 Tax=Flagellimonas zhangzhouensis TaxID=1073328 RepID=A0A1H2VKE4_9FLAO|nr:DUF5694 domain-containing protein [Allomuricauda zhangzhouensis]SDQ07250.1 hypothetical protein SAMN05216294_0174 [Allomuricauda zhangzhouensis]SDW68802.1 hypothetical protein SAMN04487892_2119 [Allomuricauda zhangzhouensis]